MEEPALYQVKIKLPMFSEDDIDSINKGLVLIEQYIQNIGFDKLNNCKTEDLTLWLKYITRKLQWIGMQKSWTMMMQEEFIKLNGIYAEVKNIIEQISKSNKIITY
jgi:hypothetical protein